MDGLVLSQDGSRKQKGRQGLGFSPQRGSSTWAEALGELEPARERYPLAIYKVPGWGYKSESKTQGPGSAEDEATLGLPGTEAGLGLSADMLNGSGNGLEKRQNIFLKGDTLQGL